MPAAIVAVVLVAVSAAAIFWAGLSLGGRLVGRDADEQAAVEAFVKTYRRINDDYVGQVEPGDLLAGALNGMLETLGDRYSSYMADDEFRAALDGISGEFEGIGARMDTEGPDGDTCEPIGEDCRLRVVEVLPKSPALEAGLLEDDVVRAVDDRPLEGRTFDDAILLIRGPRGSDVTLTLDREGREQDLTITRDVIVSRDVRSEVLADGGVGYLRVESFSSNAAKDFESALREHLDAGIERVVLDVRQDPGGFVDTAVAISSQFLADGAVFWEEDADGVQRSIEVSAGGLATDPSIRLVVLVDDGTASASEIVAGALQDEGRAQLVGESTFGKGTVQEWTELPGASGGFRLSVARWLTRDKTWIDGHGLQPDVLVDAGEAGFRPGADLDDLGSDPQLERAVSLLLADGLARDTSGAVTAARSPAPG